MARRRRDSRRHSRRAGAPSSRRLPTARRRSCTITPGGNFLRYRSHPQEFSFNLTMGTTESATVRTDRLSQGQREAQCTTSGRADSAAIPAVESAHTPPLRERPSTGVRVVVIRNRPQRVVEPISRRPELVGNFTQARQHVLHDRWGRRGAVKFPNDHRNAAGFTLGNPADIILIPPRRQPGGSAQIAARCHRAETMPWRGSIRGPRAALVSRTGYGRSIDARTSAT